MMMSLKKSLSIAAPAALLIALAAAHQAVSAADKVPTVSRQAALDNIAAKVLAPAYADLAAKSRALDAAAAALTSAPSVATVQRAQQAWKDTLLSWRRTQSFVHGPIADLDVYGRIQFWPSRRQSIDRVLRAPRAIDEAYLEELGASVVGLSAIEMMLFDPRQNDTARVAAFSGPQAERLRTYFRALTQELANKTTMVERAWQGASGYAAKFSAGGQPELNLLVNDLLSAIETGTENRLRVVLDRNTEPQFRFDVVEGGLSGTSQEGLLALLTGARAAFAGGDGVGLDDYLRQMNAPAARRLDAQFQKAIAAVQALGGPLEEAIASKADLVTKAHQECRALEILLKTEVVSALGVTLTFKSTDGD